VERYPRADSRAGVGMGAIKSGSEGAGGRRGDKENYSSCASEIRGKRSDAYIIEGGLKTCSARVLERASSSSSSSSCLATPPSPFFPPAPPSPPLRPFSCSLYLRGGRTRARAGRRLSHVHVSKQTRHNGCWKLETSNLRSVRARDRPGIRHGRKPSRIGPAIES
jgi:hypothetical protein